MATNVRTTVIYGILALYLIYSIGAIGITGILFSAAFGLVINGLGYPDEIALAAIILSGMAYKFYLTRRLEGFSGQIYRKPYDYSGKKGVPTGTGENLTEISKRVQQLGKRNVFEPTGVLSSNATEGFADVSSSAPTPGTPSESNTNSSSDSSTSTSNSAPSTSTPAAANGPTVTPTLAQQLPATNANAAKASAGFVDKATDGMFKLGQLPPDVAGGAHIDVGTTLMNALNGLKPDQVKQMTEDTRKLLETQKSLMGMLSTMKPMLTDGKQLMETFGEMFGKQ
jgi:hypothetical protein